MKRPYVQKTDRGKFSPYRKVFFACAVLFLLSMIGEMIGYGSGPWGILPAKRDAFLLFSAFFPLEALAYLLLFLSGVTVYGPFLALFSAALRGALSGFCLFLLLPPKGGQGWAMLFLLLFYLVLSAWLFLSYGSFCACAALHLFSPPKYKGEKKMFGGSLFYAPYFGELVNLRFFFSYLLFFLFALILNGALTALYAFLRGLL